MNRREAREQLFTLLFETQFVGGEDYDTVYRDELILRGLEDDAYVRRVFYGIGEHLPELDGMIAKYSSGWKSDRMSRVLRAIMRLAIYEMKYESDIPTKVSLNEAVELAKKYDTEKSAGFVNGILNSVARELEENGAFGSSADCTEESERVAGGAADASDGNTADADSAERSAADNG